MKKVLIITYYWPPSAGSGVQRWLKFSKYLPRYNWKPIIYTPENPNFKIKDLDLISDVSTDIELWKYPIWEPYALKDKLFGGGEDNQSSGVILNKNSIKNKFLNWIRGNVFIPDPKIFWVKPSINHLYKKIKNEGIEYIITTGPPHSMHLIGLGLKDLLPELKWISDFRDPWSELDILDEFSLSKFSKFKHRKLENKVLKNSDLVITVSESWVKDLRRLGAKKIDIITNGYDTDDFKVEAKKNDKFIIGHFGLLNHLRNPKYLWKSLNNMCQKNSQFNSKLEIHLAGNIDSEILLQIRSHPFLKDKVKNLKYLSHKNVLKKYSQVSVMLLLLFNSKSGIGNYPGKIFEYFASKKPIIAFGPKNSDCQNLIEKTNSGIYFTFDDTNIEKSIFDIFKKKQIFKSKNIDSYSREKLTRRLSEILNEI